MPTDRRRLLITPTPKQWEVLERFHKVTGKPRARIAVDFLGTITDQMGEIVDILERVKSLEGEALADVARTAAVAVERLEALHGDAARQLDLIAAIAAAEPPSSNTGVTLERVTPSSPSRKAA